MGNKLLVGGFALPTTTTPKAPFLIDDGKRHAQKQSFAIARALSDQLVSVGLSETALWDWVKGCHGVESRSELSELQYVVLSARLSSAQKYPVLFRTLCQEVQKHAPIQTGTCRVRRVNHDRTMVKVFEGVFSSEIGDRAQKYADATDCMVRVFRNDGKVDTYKPEKWGIDADMPPMPPYKSHRPARAFEMQMHGNEKHRIEIDFPNTKNYFEWGQQHANATGNKVVITCLAGHYVLFSFDCQK